MLSVCIPVSKYENVEFFKRSIRSLRRFIGSRDELVLIIDEGTNWVGKEFVPAGRSSIVTVKVGVGRAREACYLSTSNDILMYMDSHVFVDVDPHKYVEYMSRDVGVLVPRVCIWRDLDVLDPKTYADGSYFTFYTQRWVYIYNYSGKPVDILGSNEPVYFVRRELLNRLRKLRGITYLPYWGKEIYDVTISAWRLGYRVINVPIAGFYHLWRPSFPKGRFTDYGMYRFEPWINDISSINANPFTMSICINNWLYVLMHYSDEELEEAMESIIKGMGCYHKIAIPLIRKYFNRYIEAFKSHRLPPLKTVYSRFSRRYSNVWY